MEEPKQNKESKMEQSPSIAKLTISLIKAQMEIKVVEKEALNPFFKSKYADLPAIFAEYQRVFLKNGLAVMQIVEGKGLRTTLAHESGEYVSGLAELLLAKNDPQGLGSAITYMRRYALAAICGIVSREDDDDGNAGTHGEVPEKATTGTPGTKKEDTPATPGRVIGKITADEDGSGGWVIYYVNNIKLSTKKAEFITLMDKAFKSGSEVQVDYSTVVKGKYTNNYIDKAVVAESVPF